MIQVSQTYKEACESNNRPKSYIVAKIGSFDRTVKGKVSSITASNKKEFSNLPKLFNEVKATNYKYITCEPDRVVLDNTFYFIQDKTKPTETENIAYWSFYASTEECTFPTRPANRTPSLTITFNEQIKLTDLTFYFQEVCARFTITFFIDGNSVYTYEFNDNNSLTPTTSFGETSNVYFNKITIKFLKTKEPFRLIKLNEIDFGNYMSFASGKVLDYSIIDEISLNGSELSSNSLSISIKDENNEFDILNPKSKLHLLQEKQEISVFHYLKLPNNTVEVPLGSFLLSDITVNNNILQLEAYDDIYFLNDNYYGSRYYQNISVKQILLDLFNYFNYTNYVIEENVENIKLTGYVPIVSFREALRIIVEASCLCVKKDRNGKTNIFQLKDDVVKILDNRKFIKETPKKQLNKTIYNVKEYNYSNIVNNTNLYSSELKASESIYIIQFNEFPIIPASLHKETTNDDYEITASYANCCFIKVKNDTTVSLLGTTVKPTINVVSEKSTYNILNNIYEEVDNPLITKNNSLQVYNWKNSFEQIEYNFRTLMMPYLEVGDTCEYKTKYNTTKEIVLTRLEFSNSIMQEIEAT